MLEVLLKSHLIKGGSELVGRNESERRFSLEIFNLKGRVRFGRMNAECKFSNWLKR